MTGREIIFTLITGLIINEFGELSPWLAHKLVRWSAHRAYNDPTRAETRAEELTALINDRPGDLFKLLTALSFTGAAAGVSLRRMYGSAITGVVRLVFRHVLRWDSPVNRIIGIVWRMCWVYTIQGGTFEVTLERVDRGKRNE